MLQGPDLELLGDVCRRADAPVIASGGISTLDDLIAMATLVDDGVEGAIIGTALYTGAFSLEDALTAVDARTAALCRATMTLAVRVIAVSTSTTAG